MHLNKTLILLFWGLFFILPAALSAQSTITGKVINQADTKPASHASVFLSNSTIGTTTADDGTFTLKNVPAGKYNLIISLLGFEKLETPVVISGQDLDLQVIMLFPKTLSLKAVTVAATRTDGHWRKAYDKFLAAFLGPTDQAKECKVLNSGVLQLNYDEQKGLLTASSSDFIEIENKALGYKIKYLLKDFTLDNSIFDITSFSYHGYVLFEKLSGTAAQEKKWTKNRLAAYEGSRMQFLRAAASNTTFEEGFRVLRLPLQEDNQPDTVIYVDKKTYMQQKQAPPVATGPDRDGMYELLNNNDRLYITYNKYHHFATGSYTRLQDAGNTLVGFTKIPALFDSNGALLNPQCITYDGAWARMGIANLLPVDYQKDGIKKIYANSKIKEVANKLKKYEDSIKAEKVYLQTDKPYYAVNDTIYFKAYVTGGGNGRRLSGLSGVLNVDLIGPDGNPERTIKLKLNNGLAWGDFNLPDTLKGGIYRIQAYTNWMLNEGENSLFEKEIPVGKIEKPAIPESASSVTKKHTPKAYDVQFMPEGGTLVTGNYSKIAFRAVSPDGLGTDVKGTVSDDAGNEVCTFESIHLGMGVFAFVPGAGRHYSANITFADGTVHTMLLPPAVNEGYTLTVNAAGPDSIRLRIAAPAGAQVNKLNLIAQSGGVVYYTAETGGASRFFSTVIPKNRFPRGIVQFTLFTADGEPLNERLAFINRNDSARLKLTAKNIYSSRQKVKLQLEADDKDGAAPGNYSVAVIDEGKVYADDFGEPTIMSSMLLTAELRGYVEQPEYYFTRNDEKAEEELDLVMLTHGYRSFKWKAVLNNIYAAEGYRPEKTLAISGVVKKDNKPVPRARVRLFGKGVRAALLLDTVADAEGKFIFDNLDFSGNARFVIQARSPKGDKDLDIVPDKQISAAIIQAAPSPRKNISESALAFYVLNSKQQRTEQLKYGINEHARMLKEVTIRDKKITPLEYSQNLNGKGNADQIITSDWHETSGYTTLWDALRAKATGLSFDPITHMATSNRSIIPKPMVVVVDGTPMLNSEYVLPGGIRRGPLDDVEVNDTESIEILLGPNYGAIYGNQGAAGLIIVTTKRAKPINNYYKDAPGVIVYRGNGFYKAREFYSPQYDNPHTNQKMADLRSTIYWNPNIITDKNGKASFSYFNADGKGTYRVVIEGIDADGNLGRQILRYKVE
ncbi:carboxypeptidase regulatory-like domain-containing protein [Mucilaginibacter sp. L3T2-6]|uniref:carboxypeptidase regulatory-like domain-containing protein n=1 Tax=Mucilaginibacter sp. L3T2-6 TaxID=3062491 RepID=UPI0026766C31|nr:carboxypeptidase regulatory-like domain-containing protein [Mucilaginibacter sp. L3T2-6]MDO3643158.1 carboxypeptidase regulatory-like domain-containing protein [Mucilaginibacter sp. L3T2-6]MDV6215482.1 carboxypeptidase regulatory-like domain-containing protein [Mucilaginibacter sp. L3T2-6]